MCFVPNTELNNQSILYSAAFVVSGVVRVVVVLIREQRRFLRPRFPFARVAAVAVQSRAAHRHGDRVPERQEERERDFHSFRVLVSSSSSSSSSCVFVDKSGGRED